MGGADRRWENAVDLVEIGLEVVRDENARGAGGAVLASDSLEASATRFQVRHPDGVLVGHPHRQAAGKDLAEPGTGIDRSHAAYPREKFLGILRALVVDQAGDALAERRVKLGGELGFEPFCQGDEVDASTAESRSSLALQLLPRPGFVWAAVTIDTGL